MNTDILSSGIISNPEYLTELYSLVIAAAKESSPDNNLGKIFIPFNTNGQVRFSAKRGDKGINDTDNKIEYNADDITVIGGAATMIYEYINRDLEIEPIKRKTVDMDMVWWPRVSYDDKQPNRIDKQPNRIDKEAIISQSEIIIDFVEKVKENLKKEFKKLNGKKYIIADTEYTIKEVNITHKNAYGYGTNQLTIVLELETGESIDIIDFSIYDSASAQTPGTTEQRKLEKNYMNEYHSKKLTYINEKERIKWIANILRPMYEDPVYMTSDPIEDFKASTNNAAKFSKFNSQNINKEIIINGQQINVPILKRLKEQQEFILSNITNTYIKEGIKKKSSEVYEERLKFINTLITKIGIVSKNKNDKPNIETKISAYEKELKELKDKKEKIDQQQRAEKRKYKKIYPDKGYKIPKNIKDYLEELNETISVLDKKIRKLKEEASGSKEIAQNAQKVSYQPPLLSSLPPPLPSQLPPQVPPQVPPRVPLALPVVPDRYILSDRFIDRDGSLIEVTHNTHTNRLLYNHYNISTGRPIKYTPLTEEKYYEQQRYLHQRHQEQLHHRHQEQYQYIECYKKGYNKYIKRIRYPNGSISENYITQQEYYNCPNKVLKGGSNKTRKNKRSISKTRKASTTNEYINVLSLDGKLVLFKVPIKMI